MKFYMAELVELGIAFLCALSNHAFGCWIWRRSPLAPLDRWAFEIVHEGDIRRAHERALEALGPVVNPNATTTASGGTCTTIVKDWRQSA